MSFCKRLIFKDECGKAAIDTIKKHLDIKEVKKSGLELHTIYMNKEYEIIDYGFLKDENGNITENVFVDLVEVE